MLDYSSNLSDKNESAIVNRKITFPRASIISYASEWQIYHATTRERIAGIAMDIPSGPGKLSRAFCLIVALPTTNEAPSKQNGEMRAENRRKKNLFSLQILERKHQEGRRERDNDSRDKEIAGES